MPTITQLEYIVAVDQYRHFGQAADACHISQPSLSMQIQKVEDLLGFLIFDRNKKPILATEQGKKLIEQAKHILREHNKLLQISKEQQNEVSGEFRLAIIPTLAPYLIPLFIEKFSKNFPRVDLQIDELKTDQIIQALKEETLDAGILATPLHEKGLSEKILFYEPFYLYVSKNNSLFERKRIRESDLHSKDMWLLQDGHCLRNQVIKLCSSAQRPGIFKNIHFDGGNLETLRYLVKKSAGYTLIPHLFFNMIPESERRENVKEFEKPVPTREISFVSRRDHWKMKMSEAIQNSVLNSLPDELLRKPSPKFQVLGI